MLAELQPKNPESHFQKGPGPIFLDRERPHFGVLTALDEAPEGLRHPQHPADLRRQAAQDQAQGRRVQRGAQGVPRLGLDGQIAHFQRA